jgi:hypothetical protein
MAAFAFLLASWRRRAWVREETRPGLKRLPARSTGLWPLPLVLLLVLLLLPLPGRSAEPSTSAAAPTAGPTAAVSEYTLKAVLLFKLTRFVYLSEFDQAQGWTLCVLGNNPFGQTLRQLAAKEDPGGSFRIVELQELNPEADCTLLFIARSEERKLPAILAELEQEPAVLTVSDIRSFARKGGMIELSLGSSSREGLEIRINRSAAEARQISFNAQLLRLATLEP